MRTLGVIVIGLADRGDRFPIEDALLRESDNKAFTLGHRRPGALPFLDPELHPRQRCHHPSLRYNVYIPDLRSQIQDPKSHPPSLNFPSQGIL